ncbi:unnamed protein product [Adineta steineri]|uniref:Uncharacterized protein n=1 Tax=Adineta steineri TaxID=433720 RepID=A0A819ZFL5_9BILA|nr:unnamed protein product [Adineta steineri]
MILVLSYGTEIHQGCILSIQISSKQFLIADGRMKYVEQRFSLTIRILVTCSFVLVTGGMKAVIWTYVIQASIIFNDLIVSIIINIADASGISEVYETMKANNRLQLSVVSLDPSIRFTMWSLFIGVIFSSTAQYACIQTQSIFVAFFLCLIFQLLMLFGSIFTTRPANKQGR